MWRSSAVIITTIAGLLVPGPGLAVAAGPTAAPEVSAEAPASWHGRGARSIERFKVVPWRDGRQRRRLAAVLIVRYPRTSRTLPAKTRLTGKLRLELGRSGRVLVRVRDVAQVPVWRPGARPRVIHVLKFSARQSQLLLGRREARAWGARPPDWYAGVNLTLAANSEAVATVADWLRIPVIDWAWEQWARRDAACREPLPPEGRWNADDLAAYRWCVVASPIVQLIDQGVPPDLQKTYSGNFASCSPRIRDSRKTWELDVDRWDARFTMYDYDVTRQRRFVEASLDLTARRYGRAETYELQGSAWKTEDSWLRDLLPLTMSLSSAGEVQFAKNCPWP